MIDRMLQKVAILATKAAKQEPINGVRKTKFVVLCCNHAMVEIIMNIMIDDFGMEKVDRSKLQMSGEMDGVKIESMFHIHAVTSNMLFLRGYQFTGAAIDDQCMSLSLYQVVSERVGLYPFPANGVGPTWYGVL